ncbi:hypothetical protein UA08_07819 [Talaromyces atroroseus]|uniref:SPT2 chromatin protein n=1 Tax=Talaromyces atroroseus TaxID=1441469 RepID=A0A225AA21_TALAT|nr:hypothetical protein UA08_07819 [Talaromyces atroroseus]OKL56950.1 hypothetical protein UA08_07819 [Talaromyces atroroseus]
MSFLSSVLSSIESGTPTSFPPPTSRPVLSPPPKPDSRKSTPSTSGPSRLTTNNHASAGTKRKADDLMRRPEKSVSSSSTTNGNELKSRPKAPIKAHATSAKPTPPAVPSKPPPKGSFADLMAKAKAVQKEAPKVGVLKHQAALPKEKISKSEKKRRMEAMTKQKEAPRPGKKPGVVLGTAAGRSDTKAGVDASSKKREAGENAYKGTSRAPQPVIYKGTSNLPTRHGDAGRDRRRVPRRDEYLGTDEEDEGDFYGDYDDYYSDQSSDMEAGYEDMEEEEYEALRVAQKEDAEDIRKEAEAKKAKLERKQKLAALARSRR